MKILISNDDGYFAPGIIALAKRLSKKHDVVVVAPMSERSGTSHSVSFFSGITYEDKGYIEGIRTYAVSGSPADCVLFGVKYLLKDVKIDAVISGINTCLNAGSDIIYSGTFGAAQEGTFHRIPSIAVSLRTHGVSDYEFTADFVARNLTTLLSYAKENVTINVNVPCVKKEDIKGVKIAPVAYQPYDEKYFSKPDESGRDVFYVDGHAYKHEDEIKGGDCYQLDRGFITVTPVQMLSTDHETVRELKNAEFEL